MIAYASTTHWRSAEEKLRLDWIDGSATLTMLRSRITMNCATQQTTRIQLARRPVGYSGAGSATGTAVAAPVAPGSSGPVRVTTPLT